jgi:Lrp/AsnC family transcriptional regulator, leucine-responsive regulatory protein
MTQIDAIDERILTELQANGRLTMKALAERVGLSSPAMIERVRRLEERGIIAGYRAVIAPATLGRPLTAIVSAEVRPIDADVFLEAVNADAGVVECHRLTGTFNYLVKAHVTDAEGLATLLDELGQTGARCNASVVLASPLEWRAMGSAGEVATPSGRLRRRRANTREAEGPAPTGTRRPGRPRRPRPVETRS